MNTRDFGNANIFSLLVIATIVVVVPQHGVAQQFDWRFGFGAEFDSNIFLLGRSASKTLSNGTLSGGRFDSMSSPGDIAGTFFAELDFKTNGIGGKNIHILPSIEVYRPTNNAARRNIELGLDLEQNLPKDGRFRIRSRLTPEYFSKNYLVGATDSNGDGMIQPTETSYSPGNVSNNSFGADLRLRLAKSRRSSPFGAFVTFGAGYASKNYGAPFQERNRTGITAELDLDFELRDGVELDFGYEFESQNSSPWQQVLVLDEPKVGSDLNGDGDSQDLDVRHVAQIDRSRNVHSFKVVFEQGNFRIGGARRIRSYTTQDAADFGHNGRRDTRTVIETAMTVRTGGTMRINLNAGWERQTNNKPLELGSVGESNDYSKIYAGVQLEFRS
ncbi:MAG: hypothetical protein OEY63_04585 [Gemmatimonadota bacterium]|nr:hypothetical protein [Gemmatimonadota bacterium]